MKSAAARFTCADRDAQDEVAATQLAMGAAIIKLRAQVATLQRDLLFTEAGVLQRIGALKHGLDQRFAAERALIVDGIKSETTGKARFTKHILGDEGDPVL